MTKEKVLLVVGATVVLLIIGLPCVGYLQIWSLMSYDEHLPTVVPQGMLMPGLSSGRQTITNEREVHTYEFSGRAGQTIEMRVHPFSDVYIIAQITAVGFEEHGSVETRGKRGDDLVLTTDLPETMVYKINVMMRGSYPSDYEVQMNVLSE